MAGAIHRLGAHEFSWIARENGLRTMFDHGMTLATQGTTTVQELLRVTRHSHG